MEVHLISFIKMESELRLKFQFLIVTEDKNSILVSHLFYALSHWNLPVEIFYWQVGKLTNVYKKILFFGGDFKSIT
jgi:hypothetical protein